MQEPEEAADARLPWVSDRQCLPLPGYPRPFTPSTQEENSTAGWGLLGSGDPAGNVLRNVLRNALRNALSLPREDEASAGTAGRLAPGLLRALGLLLQHCQVLTCPSPSVFSARREILLK